VTALRSNLKKAIWTYQQLSWWVNQWHFHWMQMVYFWLVCTYLYLFQMWTMAFIEACVLNLWWNVYVLWSCYLNYWLPSFTPIEQICNVYLVVQFSPKDLEVTIFLHLAISSPYIVSPHCSWFGIEDLLVNHQMTKMVQSTMISQQCWFHWNR
jgi:hypothetical protein